MYFTGSKLHYQLYYIINWTQSFFTGLTYWAYVATKNDKYLKWMYSFYKQYHDKVFETPLETMHDLGFLYSRMPLSSTS